MGTLRAIVLLPLSAVTSLGPDELEVVLAHELAHVRRADFFWNILQTIAETLFFFHPAVWWISAAFAMSANSAATISHSKSAPTPSSTRTRSFVLKSSARAICALPWRSMAISPTQTLLTRIARILGEPMTRIPSRRLRPFSLAAACAGLVVLLLPVPHLLASLNPKPQSAPVSVIAATVTAPIAAPVAAPAIAAEVAVHVAAPSPVPAHQAATPDPAPAAEPQSDDKAAPSAHTHSDYIDQMKAAGYDVDLDKLIAMKIQDVTPEYARAMSQAGFGKLSADDLVACKIQGVTPEAIAEMKKQGLEINSIHDAISFRIFQVTPEFVSGMKAAGFDGLTSKQLLAMRVQRVTPEYARQLNQQFPGVTADDLVKARIFHIDDEFIAQANKHGFTNLPFEKLVQLRISGILDDESAKQ